MFDAFIVEIAALLCGIYVLSKGEFALSSSKVVRGWNARVIGAVICSYAPITVALGFAFVVFCSTNNIDYSAYNVMFLKLGVIAVYVTMVVTLGTLWGKSRTEWTQIDRLQSGQQPTNPQFNQRIGPPPS